MCEKHGCAGGRSDRVSAGQGETGTACGIWRPSAEAARMGCLGHCGRCGYVLCDRVCGLCDAGESQRGGRISEHELSGTACGTCGRDKR